MFIYIIPYLLVFFFFTATVVSDYTLTVLSPEATDSPNKKRNDCEGDEDSILDRTDSNMNGVLVCFSLLQTWAKFFLYSFFPGNANFDVINSKIHVLRILFLRQLLREQSRGFGDRYEVRKLTIVTWC